MENFSKNSQRRNKNIIKKKKEMLQRSEMENECYLINVKKLTAETKKKATARTTTTYNLEKNRKEIPAWYRRIGNRTQRIGLSHTHTQRQRFTQNGKII